MTRQLLPLLVMLSACPPVHQRQVEYGVMQPMSLVHPSNDRDRWYLATDLGPLGERFFFFDTGYGTTTCDDDFVAELGLEPRGRIRVRGEAGTVSAKRVKLPPFSLGGHQLEGVWCLVRDLNSTSSIRDPREVPIAGVLGMDVLSPFLAVVDPRSGTVELHPPRSQPPLDRNSSVPMRRESPFSSRRTLPVQVGAHTIRPVIDTGASGTYLDGGRLGLPVVEVREGVLVRGSGLKGEVRMDLSYYASDVVIGEQTAAEIRITSRQGAAFDDGLLGLNVLGSYRQTYDFQRSRAALEPTVPRPIPSVNKYRQEQAKQRDPPASDDAQAGD